MRLRQEGPAIGSGALNRAPSRAKPTYVKNKNAEAMLLV